VGDRLAVGLARARHLVAIAIARAAKRFIEEKEWTSFGYARIEDHARERFGTSGRWVRDLRTLAERMEGCPALARAIAGDDGGPPIGPVQALIVGRVATPETVDAWIALARRVTVRELREEVLKAKEAGSSAPVPSEFLEAGPHVPEIEDDDPEAEERTTLRFSLPPPVKVAVDEARDLHRAVCGSETSLAGFVEALVAEAYAAGTVPLDHERLFGTRARSSLREIYFAREFDRWAFLDEGLDGDEVCDARRTLEKTARLCGEAEQRSRSGDSLIRALQRTDDDHRLRGAAWRTGGPPFHGCLR
jgi:hypothetical protein